MKVSNHGDGAGLSMDRYGRAHIIYAINIIILTINLQLGFESRISRGGAESVKQSVFKPTIIDSLSELPDHSRPQRHQDVRCPG